LNPRLKRLVDWSIRVTGLSLWPVRVRGGVADGARWTLFPWSSYWRGRHEPRIQATLLALNGGSIAGWSCWDLGAHFGIYAVGLARRVGPTGQVAAFEPSHDSFERLRRHARLNRLTWLKTYQAAASDQSGTAQFYTLGEWVGTGAHLPYDGEPLQDHSVPVPVTTLRLDDLVASGEIRPPQFVKIDVEGHAHRALDGMRDVLERHRPILIVGIHSDAEGCGVMAILSALDYTFTPIEPGAQPPWYGPDLLFTPRR
jgi:FkbM family methyltransferase